MTDMLSTIAPKSDQTNFDDFTGGRSKKIIITKVSQVSGEQPISINYENDNGKPWKPCKSMRRVLINAWGSDGTKYSGRSIVLYGDPTVKFGGVEVGGIRISHMSHISGPITMALTASKTVRKPFTVQPLIETVDQPDATDYEQLAIGLIFDVSHASDAAAINAILKVNNDALRKMERRLANRYEDVKKSVQDRRKFLDTSA